jgi:hypothetical protein
MRSTVEVRSLPDDAMQALVLAVQRLGSQRAAAKALNVSQTVVNQALKGSYMGNLDNLTRRIRGALMDQTHRCPVLGELNDKQCLDQQSRPLVFTNPLRARIYHACKTCPHRKETLSKGASDE